MPEPIEPIEPVETTSPVIEPTEPIVGTPPAPRKRIRRRSLKLDREDIVTTVLQRLDDDITARSDWMEKRLTRYAKYRGWLEESSYPWPNASNPHVPVIAWNVLRMISLLYNAVLSTHPVMSSKAWKKADMSKQETVDQLLDWQVFIEADGSRKLDDFISSFVEDGPSVAHIPWVTDTRTIHDVRTFPSPDKGSPDIAPPGTPDQAYFAAIMGSLFPDGNNRQIDDDGYEWRTTYFDRQAESTLNARIRFSFLEPDDRVEVYIEKEAVVYNGPVIVPEDLEDIVVPNRCANLQPPGPSNPKGAPRVVRLARVRLDEIKRRKRHGIYDLLTDADTKSLADLATPPVPQDATTTDDLKKMKDDIEGTSSVIASTDSDPTFTIAEAYERWDVNDDGLEEDVIFWIIKEAKLLARARYLTDIYPTAPGLLPHRPFAEAHFIPVKNRWYSIGMIELLEHLSDVMNGVFKMNMDWGQMSNSPFFFYSPSSGMKPEIIRLYPGEGYPVDDPQSSVYFPQLPGRDQSWAFNMLTIAGQMTERLAMQGELQYGRVPTGKSQALRTMGTTVSLMQQADVRADQILLRLFQGIAEIYMQIHSLNQRYLPPNKQYRVVGIPEKGKDVYGVIKDKSEVHGRFDFQWKSTLLSSDKNALPQVLMEMMSVLINPLAIQLGLTNSETTYKLMRDYAKSRQQDPDRYVVRPPEVTDMPKILAEEAIDLIIQGQMPEAVPLEQPQEHLTKLIEFAKSDMFGMLTTQSQVRLFGDYLTRVKVLVDEDMKKQQMSQAASMFQQDMAKRTGAGATTPMSQSTTPPPGVGESPPVEMNEMMAEEMGG